mmetsp:Transcript_33708/g.75731  ORF Transcript_33708/g.75731 Transcript_33708/m.75731 type:complete len:214 (+) Transcript_33708:4605-5246(+)
MAGQGGPGPARFHLQRDDWRAEDEPVRGEGSEQERGGQGSDLQPHQQAPIRLQRFLPALRFPLSDRTGKQLRPPAVQGLRGRRKSHSASCAGSSSVGADDCDSERERDRIERVAGCVCAQDRCGGGIVHRCEHSRQLQGGRGVHRSVGHEVQESGLSNFQRHVEQVRRQHQPSRELHRLSDHYYLFLAKDFGWLSVRRTTAQHQKSRDSLSLP